MSESETTQPQSSPEYAALADRLRAVEAQLAEERSQAPTTAETSASGKDAYSGLTVSVRHEPDYSTELDAYGNKEQRELPGFLTFGVEVDGAFVPLLRRKAGGVLKDIERAKQSQGSDQSSTG